VEICDGIDNDCDTTIDDNLVPVPAAKTTGVCVGQVKSCVNGVLTEPNYALIPYYEATETSCDGRNNDCDAGTDLADPNIVVPNADKTAGVCVGAKKTCAGSGWQEPNYALIQYYEATEVTCDTRDNDCDGSTNEGVTRASSCGVGMCANTGVETCNAAGSWINSCTPHASSAEQCNGLDDDCDGVGDATDPSLIPPDADKHVGVCTGAKQVCTGALDQGWQNPNYATLFADYQATETLCDGKNNDCDNEIDENCPCVSGQTNTTTCGVGACAATGIKTCTVAGVWAGNTCSPLAPSTESCNNIDDNCDGTKDNGLPVSLAINQKGVCSGSQKVCALGVLREPTPAELIASIMEYETTESLCDKKDNDCDGFADTNDTNLVVPAASLTAGVCVGAKKVCSGSGYVEPTYTLIQYYELTEVTCDTRNNDCDGSTDEGCACTSGTNQSCGSNVGECSSGLQFCAGGVWGDCTGSVTAVTEDCNGLDDDCDGSADEGLTFRTTTCGSGMCSGTKGSEQCVSGSWVNDTCNPYVGAASTDVCGDKKDNDCDGKTDENCASTSSGGGGGGGGGSSFNPTAKPTAPVVNSNSEEELVKSDDATVIPLDWSYEQTVAEAVITESLFPIKRLSGNIPLSDFAENGSLIMNDTKVPLVPYPEGFVLYHYFDFDVVKEVVFEEMKLRFRVTDEWLTEQGVSRDEIVVLYSADGRWRSADATYVPESMLHESNLVNFPLTSFALGKGGIQEYLPVTIVEAPVVTEEAKDVPNTSASLFDKLKPFALLAIIIIVIGGLLVFAFMKRDVIFSSSLFHHGSAAHQVFEVQRKDFANATANSTVTSASSGSIVSSPTQPVGATQQQPVIDPTYQNTLIKVDVFIAKKRSLGVSDEQIKQILLGAGWKLEVVDERLKRR
jgi:hypothetical protein